MNTSNITLSIVDGPSRDLIFDSMKYAFESEIPIEFKIAREDSSLIKTRDTEVHTIQHEDGSGHRFNLEGYLDIKIEGEGYLPRRFNAFYDTKTRRGSITFKRF